MNERIRELAEQAIRIEESDELYPREVFDREKFAELIVRECMEVARQRPNPQNLNYKPSERFVEDLRQHFGVE